MTVTEFPQRPDPTDDAPDTAARAPRWQPQRAGLLNVWRYYDEVFSFHDGRVLLRGPNGTGKSKALELLLPFLFDASLKPNRLSTFGTSERTMHWNLMGEGATGKTRVGYVWLECAWLPERDAWFTCGARLQATANTSGVKATFFTTTRRVGEDLELTNESGQPLTPSALAEALGEHGTVHEHRADYRSAVRQTLFPGLSEQRYDALITALLQLRMPKLSQRLDPALLSTLLSHALPPLDEEDIAELAEGFERLDRQRERLAQLDAEADAARRVAERQRTYARRVLRAAAAGVTASADRLDTKTRAAREAEREHADAVAARAEAEERVAELERGVDRTDARIDGLTDSEAYREGRQLDELREQVVRARRDADDRDAAARRKEAEATADAERAERAETELAGHEQSVSAAAEDTDRAARRAGLEATHAELAAALGPAPASPGGDAPDSATPALDSPDGGSPDGATSDGANSDGGSPDGGSPEAGAVDGDSPGGSDHGRTLLDAAVQSRTEAIRRVRAAVDEHDRAVHARTDAERRLETVRGELAEAHQRREDRSADYDAAVHRHALALQDWAGACVELAFPDPSVLAEHAESEHEVRRLVDEVAEARRDALAGETADLDTRLREAEGRRAELSGRLAELRQVDDLPPQAPPHRTADRAALPGAPLWKLVAFADDVPPERQAAVEAALQASGLLDAWVLPSGDVTVDGHDTFTVAGAAPAERSLWEVLRPEPDGAVPTAVVDGVLSAVAYGDTLPGDGSAAVGADGRWRLGSVTGSWAKDEVEHIGALARERSRQRLIEELTARLGELDRELDDLAHRREALEQRRRTLAAERERRPSAEPVAAAWQAWDKAEDEVTRADRAVRAAGEELDLRQREAQAAEHALHLAAGEHTVPTGRDALDALETAVFAFRRTAEAWLSRHDRLRDARWHARAQRETARRSADTAADLRAGADRAGAEADTVAERLYAVESTVGADYRQVLSELDELRRTGERLREELRAARSAVDELGQRRVALEAKRTRTAEERDEAARERDTATEGFRHLALRTFPDDAGIELTLSSADDVAATREAARAVAAALPDETFTETAISTALNALIETVHACRDTLSGRADLQPETEGRVQELTATVDGVRVGAHRLHTILREDAERSRGDITAAERELFDKTLTGDIRRQLAERIRQANEMVDAMNARLQRVRTASRVAVKLVWEVNPELPAGTRDARDLLLKSPVGMSDADRDSLHRFFRERIEQAKADNTASSWQEQLARVFDYTAWHRFVVKLDRADGRGWQPLTKKLHGALSGGEKAIALHLPLFAAVAAHYQSVPEAPRLILLDEVFVGVDSDNRGQVFDLLTSLDLDLMLTSDHEWGAYRELPGIAVHQLITGDGPGGAGDAGVGSDVDDAVTTARFVWTGAGWEDGES